MKFLDRLSNKLLILDGGFGTMLIEKGMKSSDDPMLYNLSKSDMICEIHKEYINAGADIISSNTFGALNHKFENYSEIIKAAINIAKRAKSELQRNDVLIAFDIGSTGEMLKPYGDLSFESCVGIYAASMKCAEESGADLILIETMSDLYEMKAAIIAAKENTSLPIICSATFSTGGRILTGADPMTVVTVLESLGVDVIGINCGLGPEQMMKIVPQILEYSSLPVLVQPNAGLPIFIDGKTEYNLDPEDFSSDLAIMCKMGIHMIGGCCGTNPSHIKAAANKCKDIPLKKITEKKRLVATSGTKSIEIGDKHVVIGERINPTGKQVTQQALEDRNFDYLIDEAEAQISEGADIIDVNVYMNGVNQAELLQSSIEAIQEIINNPLSIDTSDALAMENALRVYNGKAIINSLTGTVESMKKIIPLAKKYGGILIGMTFDENGFPFTAEGRLEIAEKIIKEAIAAGIKKRDIIIDPLALTASMQQGEAFETLKTLRLIKEKLGVKTILGISNVSFGMPNRDLLNSTYLAIALYQGLDVSILNPAARQSMETITAYNALSGTDELCEEYINVYRK